MSSDPLIELVATDCRSVVKKTQGDLIDKLRASMRAARKHWLVTDERTQFLGALAAVLVEVGMDSEDGERITKSSRALVRFRGALQAGSGEALAEVLKSIDIDTLIPSQKFIHLENLWQESKE